VNDKEKTILFFLISILGCSLPKTLCSSNTICSRSQAAARVRAQVRSCAGQSGIGAGFLRVLRFPLPILIPQTAPHSSCWYSRPNSGRLISPPSQETTKLELQLRVTTHRREGVATHADCHYGNRRIPAGDTCHSHAPRSIAHSTTQHNSTFIHSQRASQGELDLLQALYASPHFRQVMIQCGKETGRLHIVTLHKNWALLEKPPTVRYSKTSQHFMETEG
jgi:hypothetical protein